MSGTLPTNLPGVRCSSDASEDDQFWIWKFSFFFFNKFSLQSLFSFSAQPLFGVENIYPIAEVEYDHLFTKKSRAAQQLKTKYVTLVTLGQKL